jgi:hypothetical protein
MCPADEIRGYKPGYRPPVIGKVMEGRVVGAYGC